MTMDIDTPDDFSNKSETFLTWLRHGGVNISSKIELSDQRHRHAGRAVLATQNLSEDEELFSVPRSSILTAETSTLPSTAKLDDPWLSLIIALIHEHLKGASSAWKPYLDVLPSYFDTLMFWSDAELKPLEGSAVLDKIGKETADRTFRKHVLPVVRQQIDAEGLGDEEILQLAHRFGSTIMSYAFDLENPAKQQQRSGEEEEWEEDQDEVTAKGMVPLADMLNADADRNNAKLFYEDELVIMRALKPIIAGEEIFNDYGPLPRADVLRRYGYVTDNYAHYDVVEVSHDLVATAAKEVLKLKDGDLEIIMGYLDSQGVCEDGYDIARPGNDDAEQFSEELKVILNTLTLSKADFDKLRKKDKLPKPELSTAAAELLYAILVRRRAAYRYADEAAQLRSGNEYRISMAEQVLAGEKEVLRRAAETIQSKLGGGSKKRKADTFEQEAAELQKWMKK